MSRGLAPGFLRLACHVTTASSPVLLTGGGEGQQESSGAAAHSCSLCLPSLAGLPGSEFQVQAPARGTLGRVYSGSRGSEKHSPDSACSVDYSSSRLSSPEHPNEGKAAALREGQDHADQWTEVGVQ